MTQVMPITAALAALCGGGQCCASHDAKVAAIHIPVTKYATLTMAVFLLMLGTIAPLFTQCQTLCYMLGMEKKIATIAARLKTATIAARLSPQLKKAGERQAAREGRTLSGLMVKLLADYIQRTRV